MPEFLHDHQFLYYTLILVLSILITLQSIPSILHVARMRHLYDDLGHFRKEHDHGIPRLGGVAIFVSFIITLLLFCVTGQQLPLNYILASCVILFAVGLKDDLSGVNPSTKFFMQFVVSAILVIPGNIRLTSMYGVLGIHTLGYLPSVCFTILTIILIVNAFNLIDGIDGLAGTTGVIVNGAFAALFIYIHQYELASVCLAMVGALVGFLRYNLTPAKIFMGDTGSMLLGLVSVVMAIKFIEVANSYDSGLPHIHAIPALAIAILIGPIFDTFRVFSLRILNKKSPFKADRTHVHHRILRLGFNHLQTTMILAGVNVISIALALLFHDLGSTLLIVIICVLSLLFNWGITFAIRCKERGVVSVSYLFG
ncbi:MraY family glycosyltransferase [Mucilaginibacter myungsuensis]|uniref:Undecaprenyl/decaprenyl-phosphate alpha-N-acetylglucosaminyl 1-phosphate transferase n=1 Tax=Mucilaginibacter myungsuensis TaxID=649104 RepID=A0A929PUJ0_9SPHI|nr:MraY family glycosyltransferase [Mucilaginibacter myungsuensis]MBE9660813.1 undecaprenyl/decaprenyl-phosphate alpha-N-acetylglucosaminyl 1-phosphate transferase [Mucilaginibacter myungsuensis]MDN3600859.1 MraY family glycosyltransferase [Mucilaginibacter myungsuensis]